MAPESDKDRLSLLVDDILWHVLSFLPGDHALQTCVLSPRWRDLWRSTTSLRFNLDDWPSNLTPERFEQLVKLIIHLRGNSPLVKCEINAYPDEVETDELEYTYTCTKLLITYALTCQAEELLVNASSRFEDDLLPVFNGPLISQHLKTMHLERVNLEGSALNFSRCTVLEDLKMESCNIHAHKISSKSLKHMCITGMCIFPEDFHTRIFAPGLTDLQLDGFEGLPPFLEYMPFLVTGYVGLSYPSLDICHENHYCGCHAYPVEDGVFLHGLSNAVNLKLIAEPQTSLQLIYRSDLEWCPIFDKLKTLLLNDWFRGIDLVCLLQHSPILEMLTLQLGYRTYLIGARVVQETIEQSCVRPHLKVNIRCSMEDDRTHTILKILRTCGILEDRISINGFSFQKGPIPAASFY